MINSSVPNTYTGFRQPCRKVDAFTDAPTDPEITYVPLQATPVGGQAVPFKACWLTPRITGIQLGIKLQPGADDPRPLGHHSYKIFKRGTKTAANQGLRVERLLS